MLIQKDASLVELVLGRLGGRLGRRPGDPRPQSAAAHARAGAAAGEPPRARSEHQGTQNKLSPYTLRLGTQTPGSLQKKTE